MFCGACRLWVQLNPGTPGSCFSHLLWFINYHVKWRALYFTLNSNCSLARWVCILCYFVWKLRFSWRIKKINKITQVTRHPLNFLRHFGSIPVNYWTPSQIISQLNVSESDTLRRRVSSASGIQGTTAEKRQTTNWMLVWFSLSKIFQKFKRS